MRRGVSRRLLLAGDDHRDGGQHVGVQRDVERRLTDRLERARRHADVGLLDVKTKDLEAIAKHIAATESRLANKAFTDKAPAAVLEGARKQLADQQAKQAELQRLLASLGS